MDDSYQDGYQGGYNFAEDSGYTGDGQNVESGHYGNSDGISAQGGDKINARDDDEKKLFVGGLSWETTQLDLKDYFANFGDIVDVTVKTDPVTGRSRGFGFVLFTDISAVDNVMQQQSHTLNSRTIDPKRAKTRGGRESIKKIFVGGLDPNFPETGLREYFGKFGNIEEIELPYDKLKEQRRAFCFVTFDSEDAVDEICKHAKQMIGSKECDVKKATPRSDAKRGGGFAGQGSYGGQGGGYGGQGGGYGGQSGGYGGQSSDGYGGQASYGYSGGRGRGRSGGYNQNQVYGRSNYSSYNQNYGYGQGYGGYSG